MNFKTACFFAVQSAFLISCGQGMISRNLFGVQTSTSNGQCKIRQEKLSAAPTTEVFSNEKIHRDDFFDSNQVLSAKATSDVLNQGQNVTIVVSVPCFVSNDKKLNDSIFKLNGADIQPRDSNYSQEESINAQLNRDISLQDLKDIVNKDECIVGLGNSVKIKRFAAPNDPGLKNQKYLSAINYSSTYDFYYNPQTGIRNNSIIVAIIDDGTDIDHPDLKPNVWINQAEKNGTPGVDDDHNGYIDDIEGWDFGYGKVIGSGDSAVWDILESNNPRPKDVYDGTPASDHGTHVAGLAAAVTNNQTGISGVIAKDVKIMALNVFGNSPGPESFTIDKAIRYAADNGAKVINMSLGGGGKSSGTESALAYAISKGVIIVAAAGNDNKEIGGQESATYTNFFSPASYAKQFNGMIAVGATDASNTNARCSFSNFSTTYVEIAAPGCDSQSPDGLLSTYIGGLYGFFQGTSQASPVVAGAAAVAYSMVRDYAKIELSPASVETVLTNSAVAKSGLTNYIKGGKQLDLSSMATYIQTNYPISPCQ